MDTEFLRKQEAVALELKSLYKSYGFKEYKLSSFEEYALYAENESFLSGKDMITFNAGGKLMALRPDVTLSVVKNVKAEEGTQKLFYDEKVYRPRLGGEFAEVSQIGVEVIGDVDIVAEAETVELMQSSLSKLSKSYLIDVSHIGIIEKTLNYIGVSGSDREFAVECLTGKNSHDFLRFAREKGIPEERSEVFVKLMTLPPTPDEAIAELEKIKRAPEIGHEIDETERLIGLLADKSTININFSIVGNAEYYNGLIFKGYINGVPQAVLSGGRYDRLLKKFRKNGQAVGFAVYLGELERYFSNPPANPDVIIVYDRSTGEKALAAARAFRKQGKKVLLSSGKPAETAEKTIYAEEL